MTTITLGTRQTLSNTQATVSGAASSASSVGSHPARVFAVPRDQLYYWSRFWQENEQAAVRELDEGDARTFSDAGEAVRWLLSEDD